MESFSLSIKRSGGAPHAKPFWQQFGVPVISPSMSVLDALLWVQQNDDPTLAFRCACRVGMCGSCGVVINGREGLACRTLVRDLAQRPQSIIKAEPMRHLPVIRDLVTDPTRFYQHLARIIPIVSSDNETDQPAVIRPDSKERKAIDPQRECIYCGLCYSACSVVGLDGGFLGPAALNRAFVVESDSRDKATSNRMQVVASEAGLWRCHTIFQCTAVCPKGIPITKAIEGLKRKVIVGKLKRLMGLGP